MALGSALAGAAQNMSWLVAARGAFLVPYVVQPCADLFSAVVGIGAGGIYALSSIIIADLVPLQDRGPYTGLLGL